MKDKKRTWPKPRLFTPANPSKYKGKSVNNIVARSNWELQVMKFLDRSTNVVWWSSEELSVTYISPIDGYPHRYFPDFIVKIDKQGKQEVWMIEVKPHAQTQPPTRKRKTKVLLQEIATYQVNQAKWKAADIFCQKQGWIFKIFTEKDIFGK